MLICPVDNFSPMTLQGKGKIYSHARNRVIIYIPAAVHRDSAFPFKLGDEVIVRIEKKRLVIEPKKKARIPIEIERKRISPPMKK